MHSTRNLWVLILTIGSALLLLSLTTAMVSAQKPVITTPTPTPSAPLGGWDGLMENNPQDLPLVWSPELAPPEAVSPDPFTYTVQITDTLWSLAMNFGRDLDTMSCVTRPRGNDAASLVPGQVITVPGLSDLCYTVTPYDTLRGIAWRYGLTVEEIAAIPWNELSPPYNVVPRQRILLPGVRPEAPARPNSHLIESIISVPDDDWSHSPWPEWPYGDGHFIWPVTGEVSQGYHDRHRALDIAVPPGTPVRAADRGTVMMAGWSPVGYGFRVVVDHHIDYTTLYAHMSDIYVEEGELVAKGQVIGVTGANGNVTGPHLHFEIRDFGILVDPQGLLQVE